MPLAYARCQEVRSVSQAPAGSLECRSRLLEFRSCTPHYRYSCRETVRLQHATKLGAIFKRNLERCGSGQSNLGCWSYSVVRRKCSASFVVEIQTVIAFTLAPRHPRAIVMRRQDWPPVDSLTPDVSLPPADAAAAAAGVLDTASYGQVGGCNLQPSKTRDFVI